MLKELAKMSAAAGARMDYVQGGGGNTSVKLGNGLMAIKASGFRLRQVTAEEGFAVVETETLRDVTAEQGYKPFRPSVEASFHAMLGTFVLHTHPVYANLVLCSVGGLDRLPEIMDGISYITVPYINPGAELASAIRERKRPDTQAVFMVNHGLVVTADSADECLRLQEEINSRCAAAYGTSTEKFDAFAAGLTKKLYPDQQVYLSLTDVQQEVMAAVMFIQFTLRENGVAVQGMDDRAMGYIAGWEGESYRRRILNEQ